MRRAFYIGLAIPGILLALVAGLFGALQTGFARDHLRTWIADLTAGTPARVRLDAVEGLVPFDMRLVHVQLSDRDGPWLTADRVSVDWTPSALLRGRLQVDALTAGTIDVQRTPAAEQTQEPSEPGPLIPELPVDIDLRQLSIARLALAAPILGEPAALSVTAHAKLGEIGDGLSASLSLQQLSGHAGTARIDLAYRPEQDTLALKGNVQEPQGGVLGRLLGLPQGSDLRVALTGEGPLSNWSGRMDATLDGKTLLSLTATSQGRETRTIAFTLHGAPAPLVPDHVRPLVANGIDASGTITVPPDTRTIGISSFSARSAAGQLSASGVLGLKESGDLGVTIALADSRPFAALVPDIAWSAARLQGRLQGTIDTPHVTADVAVQDLAAGGMKVGTGELALDANAGQGFDDPVGMRGDLNLSDLASPDPRLTALLARGVHLAFAGSVDQAGTIIADKLDLQAGALALSGSGRAEKWGAAARKADATLAIADLAAIGTPMGVPAKGTAQVALKLAPAATGDRLEIDGTTEALSLGRPILDRLLGSSPRLHLALEGALPQTITIKAAEITGAKARLDAHGAIAERKLDLAFATKLDDAQAIDPAMRGEVGLDGTIQGTIEAPSLSAQLTSPDLRFAERSAQNVKLNVTATDLLTMPQVQLDGTASLQQLPAKLAASVAVEGQRIAARNVAFALGKSTVTGDVAMVNGLLTGKLALDAPELGEIAPLAGTDMGGAVSATIALDGTKGQQGAHLAATGRNIAVVGALTAERLDLTATANDLFGAPTLAAELALAKPVIADHPLTQMSLTARGPLSALDAKLSVAGPDLNATAGAQIAQITTGYRIALQTLAANIRKIPVKNTRPAIIEIGGDATRIETVALAIEDGTLELSGTVAPDKMELAATARSLPVSLTRVLAPDFPITGRVDADVQLSGAPAAPSGRFAITGKDIGPGDAAQQADLQVTGTLQQGRLDVKGEVKPKAGGALTFTAALPSLGPDARLQASASGTLDLALVDAFLAGGADRIKGKAQIDLAAGGTLRTPDVTGTLHLADASYENLRYGIKLRQIEADVRASGSAIQVASLTAATPGGGHVDGSGEIDLKDGIDTRLKIQMRNARLIETDLASAVVDSDLAITGNLQKQLTLGGKVKIAKADIRVPDRLPPSVQVIEVTEINGPGQAVQHGAARQVAPEQTLIVALDLAVDAPQQVAVRGRGLDVELGGSLKIAGTTDKPLIDGALKLRRGSLDIAGKRLDFTEGTLTFEGGAQIDPILDLTAVSRTQDLQVTAKVEGPAQAPRITLSSVPEMPQDEILAHLLFGKSAGALSPFELLQLAQATADLAGVNTGPGILDKIRKTTGLDRLSLEQSEGAGGPSLSAGRYVAKGVYVGVSQGANSGSSAATVEIEVTPNVKVESEVGANAGSKAGINLEWDY
ncbi:MAG TPA: translocation/assembly module TamB domain-containing protein [Dongiaceae bacterium]|nr:translocation/assembly module TamB domain-containing protein [Dongiaceae bacterium]